MSRSTANREVYLALHEERFPCAAFSTRADATAWIRQRPEPDYSFSIELLTVDAPAVI